jgi:integrase
LAAGLYHQWPAVSGAIRKAILRGDAGIATKKKDLSFTDASKIFLNWAQAHKAPRTHEEYESCMGKLSDSFGDKMLSQISPFLIEAYKIRRVKEGAKVRPNRELGALRNLYNKMLKFKKYEGENPVRGFEPIKESRGKDRILEPAEELLLLQNAGEPLRSLIVIGLQTGLRVNREALSLTWDNVNLPGRTLTVAAAFSKTHEMREVSLNSIALATLKRLKTTTPGPWVFMTRGRSKDGPLRQLTSFKSAFERACERANLSGVTPHSLRHTWASRMEMSGASQKTLMELGGWKDPKMVARYSHTSKQHRMEAVERIANYSPSVIPTAKSAKPVTPYAPVAQVDRATVS